MDGGGIFKEFLESVGPKARAGRASRSRLVLLSHVCNPAHHHRQVVKEGFDPDLGLFKATTDNRLYPNPHAQVSAAGLGTCRPACWHMLGRACPVTHAWPPIPISHGPTHQPTHAYTHSS